MNMDAKTPKIEKNSKNILSDIEKERMKKTREYYDQIPEGIHPYPSRPTAEFLALEKSGYIEITEISLTKSKYYKKLEPEVVKRKPIKPR